MRETRERERETLASLAPVSLSLSEEKLLEMARKVVITDELDALILKIG